MKYTRDTSLGLWVPGEMKETYSVLRFPRPRARSQAEPFAVIAARNGGMDVFNGIAKYTKFRRFQVKTETNVTIPK